MGIYMEFNEDVRPTGEMLKKLLSEHVCVVSFTKVNGESRTMPCTLRPDMLPIVEPVEPTTKKERKTSDTNISVWCTDKNEWRSFRLDSIHSINVV